MIKKNETVSIGWCDNGITDGAFTEGLMSARWLFAYTNASNI